MKKVQYIVTIILIITVLSFLGGCDQSKGNDNSIDKNKYKKIKANKKYKIVTVVKADDSEWFKRMKEGIKEFKDYSGHEAYQIAPQKPDADLQAEIIEKLIDDGVDAICVVPFSTKTLEPILKKAREKGIVVISHEAPNLKNKDYDIEPFDNEKYGSHLMEKLGELMNEEGEYATFVGRKDSESHNKWIDGAIKTQKEKYPKMQHVAKKLETQDEREIAYEHTKQIIQEYPNLKGIQSCAVNDLPAAAQAVEEMDLQEQVTIVGTSLVSVAKEYLNSGTVKMISLWDPAKSGYAMNKLAVMVLDKVKIKDGLNLGVEGYTELKLEDSVLIGEGWIDVTKENMKQYDF